MPVISKPIQTSARVNVNYDAADALQTVEALLAGVDLERGTELWPTFLQLANDHPQAPGASRVQMELPAPLKPGEALPPFLTGLEQAQPELPTKGSTITAWAGGRLREGVVLLADQRSDGSAWCHLEIAGHTGNIAGGAVYVSWINGHWRDDSSQIHGLIWAPQQWARLGPQPDATDEPTPLNPGEVDLAAVIAAQFSVPVEQAAAVADRVALFLNPRPEPEPEPEPSQSELRKQRKPRTVMSKEAEQALAASIREHLAMDEPPYGWKSALARQYGVTASVITQRINALEVA
jgi:hypothetical protein